MNYIFVNILETDDIFKVSNRAINERMTLKEININRDLLEEMLTLLNSSKSLYKKYKLWRYRNKLKKVFISCMDESKNCYILSKEIVLNTDIKIYIKELLGSIGYDEYVYKGEYKNNIEKHIDNYASKNNIDKINSKCLLIYKKLESIDNKFLEELISNHKKVDIYSEMDVEKYVIKKLNEFNQDEGTTITLAKSTKKAFKEYKIVIFVDSSRENFKKLRLDKSAFIIDLTNIDEDFFDSNYISVEEMLKNNNLIETIIKRMYSNYGKNVVSSIVTKIT